MTPIRRRALWRLLTATLCAAPAAVWAAPSLPEMVQAATLRNPAIELAGAERRVAEALRRKADQPFAGAPTANVKYQTDTVGSDLGYREWEGGVELPLWLPGQAARYLQEADRSLGAADALHEAKRLEIAGEVRERLWGAAIARSEADQAQSAVTAAKELLHDIERRVAAGELPRSDRLLAEKALLQREEDLQLASTRADQAERLFNRYTGLDLPQELAAEAPDAASQIPEEHPRLRLAQSHIEQARAHRDRVGGEARSGPNLWLGAKTTKAAAGNDYDSSVGLELSVPFGTAGHSAPALAEAEAALTQAQVENSATRLSLEDDLTEAGLELARARAALAQTERRLTLAEESLVLHRRAFELGETDLVRLLQAQADALSARHDLQIRRLELGRAAARLNQALGVIPQ